MYGVSEKRKFFRIEKQSGSPARPVANPESIKEKPSGQNTFDDILNLFFKNSIYAYLYVISSPSTKEYVPDDSKYDTIKKKRINETVSARDRINVSRLQEEYDRRLTSIKDFIIHGLNIINPGNLNNLVIHTFKNNLYSKVKSFAEYYCKEVNEAQLTQKLNLFNQEKYEFIRVALTTTNNTIMIHWGFRDIYSDKTYKLTLDLFKSDILQNILNAIEEYKSKQQNNKTQISQ